MGDKRKVSTDALETLGTIIDETAGRDAIHLAVEPVVAGMALNPGDYIRLHKGVAIHAGDDAVGIVDPFLRNMVERGERFWLVVLPRTITSLRHVWSHPAFPEQVTSGERARSEAWLREFVSRSDCPSYEEVIGLAVGHQHGEDAGHGYLLVDGEDAHGEIPPEFWDHVQVVTGIEMRHRATYFSCSC